MSLYEIVTMSNALEARDKTQKPKVTDDEWAQAEALLASVTVNDPSVRLH